jgi:hypothetical protein
MIIYMTLCLDIDLVMAAVQHSDIRLRPGPRRLRCPEGC